MRTEPSNHSPQATGRLSRCRRGAGQLAIVLAGAGLAVTAGAETYTWLPVTVIASYDWNNEANWTPDTPPGFPNGGGDVANLTPTFTGNNFGTPVTINLNETITVGTFAFYDASDRFRAFLTLATGTGGDGLIFANGANAASLSMAPSNQDRPASNFISANCRLDSDLTIWVPTSIYGGKTIPENLSISGNIGQGAGDDRGLTKIGEGRLTLSGNNTYKGGTTAGAGVVHFANSSALPANGTLKAQAGAYVGAGFEATQGNFIDRFDKANTQGTIGLAVDTANPIDLTDFHPNARLGGKATLSGTITPQGDTYRFAGGMGSTQDGWGEYKHDDVLTIASQLTDGPEHAVRHLDVDRGTTMLSGIVAPANAANSFTGNTTIRAVRLRVRDDGNLGVAPTSPTPGKIVLLDGSDLEASPAGASLTIDANRGIALGPPSGSGTGTLRAEGSKVLIYSGSIVDNAAGTGNLVIAGGTVASGTGLVQLTGSNSYSGFTRIAAGGMGSIALRADDGVGLPAASNLQFIGGPFNYSSILETKGEFTRAVGTGPGEVQWLSKGGFAAVGGPLTLNFGGTGATLKYGDPGLFGGGTADGLHFNSVNGTDVVTLVNGLDLDGNTERLLTSQAPASPSAYAVITGKITNTGGTGGIGFVRGSGGLVVFANDGNDFDGAVRTGNERVSVTLGFTSIADVNGGPSALGAPTTVERGTITLGMGSYPGIRYLGTDPVGHTSDRVIFLNNLGSNPVINGRVEASGVGPLTLTSSPTGGKPLIVGGTGVGRWTADIGTDVTGIANLSKADSGLWVLSGANTYTGATTISSGALRAAEGQGLPGTALVLGNGVLETGGTFTRSLGTGAGQVSWTSSTANAAGFSAQGAPLSVNIGGNATPDTLVWATTNFANASGLRFGSAWSDNVVTFENPLNLGNTTRTVRVDDNPDSAADRAVLAGQLSGVGGGIRKAGDGTLVLSNANSNTGTTTVDAGTLLVTNTSGSATGTGAVNVTGGILGGTGTITGAVSNTGGTISPGLSPGKLTVQTSVTQTSAGSMLFEFAGDGQGTGYDWLDVGGTVTLGSGTLQVSLIDGFQPKYSSYSATIITADAVGGTFNPATILLPADVLNNVTVTTIAGAAGLPGDPGSVVLSNFDLFPIADIVVSSAGGGNYLFDGQGSYDPDDDDPATYATLTSFKWTLNDVVLGATDSQVMQPLGGGLHVLTLVVTDDNGTTGSMTLTFMVPEPGAFGLLALGLTLAGMRRRR